MIKLIEDGTISSKIAKKVFKELIENGGDCRRNCKSKRLVQISDEGALREIVTEFLMLIHNRLKTLKTVKTVQLAS